MGKRIYKPRTHCPAGHEYTEENKLIRKTGKDAGYPICKLCIYKQSRRWKASQKDREEYKKYKRDREFLRLYGVTLEERDRIMETGCAICKAPATHLDHDHATGKLRGPLCRSCNHGLGNFRDNPEFLAAAIQYLKKGGVLCLEQS